METKRELCHMGGEIPTSWLVIIPFANFYFWYRYAEVFAKFVKPESDPISYFVLMALLPFIGILVIQNELNKVAA